MARSKKKTRSKKGGRCYDAIKGFFPKEYLRYLLTFYLAVEFFNDLDLTGRIR